RIWGAVVVTSRSLGETPEEGETRLRDFSELVSLAVAGAEARRELRASRSRLVQAADYERRRLEQNLHGGAQQRLVSMRLALRREASGSSGCATAPRRSAGRSRSRARAARGPSFAPCCRSRGDGPARERAGPGAALRDRDDVRRLGALLPLAGLELDLRALGERLEARAADLREVDEQVLPAVLGLDEPEALRVVEPLHGSGCHGI